MTQGTMTTPTEEMPNDGPKPFFGSVEFMPEANLAARLKSFKTELSELLEEQRRREAFTSTERLADRLHNLLHRRVDCDYNYSKWPHPTGCRSDFWSLAAALEQVGPQPYLDNVLRLMEAKR